MICEFWTLSIVMDFLTLVPNSSLESVTNCEVGIFWSPGWLSSQLAILAGGQSGTVLCSHDQIWWTTQSPVHCRPAPPLHTILLVSLFSGYWNRWWSSWPTTYSSPPGHPVLITVPLLLRLGNSARARQESCTASQRSGPQSHSFFTTCALTFAKIINQRV